MKKLALLFLTIVSVSACFSPVVYLQNKGHYPVDVFYDTQRPDRPFDPLQDLEVKGEVPLTSRQSGNERMLSRGNDAQQKELMLSRLTLQAKKLGADALVSVRYTYYTSMTDNGYVMTGVAVKYKQEHEARQ
ncbi:YbjQ family protein [Spirosoma endophyticum]|uniref:Heavy-metal-binding n=1 Tax=Spirosoma endophyticum TaxID=662367 RepID=A0A1I1T4Z2_9BACT|nr:hypothetical protein [Spirosoma endophyticum]SFD53632.1 hypothetical protein SAMN05216167_105346 [Spirosoma endophyticum]